MARKIFLSSILLVLSLAACGTESGTAQGKETGLTARNPVTLELRPVESAEPLAVVTAVDAVQLDRYLGTWYEVASIPAWFQSYCKAGVKANYSLRDDGRIRVTNSCRDSDGVYRELEGQAAPLAVTATSKLRVSFLGDNLEKFGANYWVLYLSQSYDLVLVGEPNREYGWVLSRTPAVTQEQLDTVSAEIDRQGYSVSRFKLSDQAPNLE